MLYPDILWVYLFLKLVSARFGDNPNSPMLGAENSK